jgi:tetratricopeptide (TPR) repeat protein
MRFWPFWVAAFCSLAISPSPWTEAAEVTAAVEKQQPSLADRYRQALAVDPDNLPLHYFLGVTLLTEGREREAIAEFSLAYPAYVDSIEMNYNLGLAYSRTGDPDSALLYFDQAEALGALEHPELYPLANAYYNLGVAYLETDSFEDVVRLFTKILTLDPDRQDIHRQLGDLYARHGRTDRALEEFGAYLKAYPDDTATREYIYALHFNRAQQLLESKDLDGSRAAFNEALAATPGSPLAIYYLGYLDYAGGDFETAASRLTEIHPAASSEVRQSIDSILYNCAVALLEQRKLKQALAAVEPLLGQRTPELKSLYLAGNIHLALKEFDRARTCYKSVLALEADHRGAIMNMVAAEAGAIDELFAQGRALFRQEEYLAALQKLEAALAINPTDARALVYAEETRIELSRRADELFSLAQQTLQRQNPDEALKQVREGLTLTPDSARGAALETQALADLEKELAKSLAEGARLAEQGMFGEAERSFARVLELDPANAQAREGTSRIARLLQEQAAAAAARGTLALEDGRLAEAREAFETALESAPEQREAVEGISKVNTLVSAMAAEERQWGRRAQSAGRLEQAREHFTSALRFRDDPDTRNELAAIDRALADKLEALMEEARKASARNNFKRATSYFEQVLAQEPQHAGALREREEVKVRAATAIAKELAEASEDLTEKEIHRAIARFRQVLDIDPTNETALSGLNRGRRILREELTRLVAQGNAAIDRGEFREAEASLRKALSLDPYQKEPRAALSRLEQMQQSGIKPEDEQQLYLQGIEYYTRGKYEEAVTAWEQVLVLSPRHEKARLNIEKARRKLQQIREYGSG